MNVIRTSIALTNVEPRLAVCAAKAAEANGIRALWLGNPRNSGQNAVDPSFTTATAGAVAGVTQAIRIGLFLTLGETASPLRLAEDIGVLDNLSGGRVELSFSASAQGNGLDQAAQLMDAWDGWQIPDDEVVAIVPSPIQPIIPCLLAGEAKQGDLARFGSAGVLSIEGEQENSERAAAYRHVMMRKLPFSNLSAAGSEDKAIQQIQELRKSASANGFREIMIEFDGLDEAEFTDFAAFIGSVIDPAMRCSELDIPAIVKDAWQMA
ncbi:MAG: LLM class flavin-dependent oxidoreductase [Novosphingobium sp.]|nr:LLM class flavin-dependent oxidoreductase [Novosphingobium sp.]